MSDTLLTDQEQALLVFLNTLRDSHYWNIIWLPDGKRYTALAKQAFTWRLILGQIGDAWGYDDCWCFHDMASAQRAQEAWDGTGEPAGWHRHPPSGRRVSDGTHYDQDDKPVPAGQVYVRP